MIEICETLDGLPLGIELAAARMAAMSAVEVRDRLGDRFRLLTGPEYGPDRQLTLRHAVAWSYDLLDDDERALLRTASVFAGGFDLPALCAVAGDAATTSRCCGSSTRWCASRWWSPTTGPTGPGTACSRPSARSPTSGWPRPPSARRSAIGMPPTSRSEAAAPLGALERPRVA